MPENSNQSKFSNYSLDFDGTNSIDCGTDDIGGALSLQGNFTISLWFNTSGYSSSPPQYVLSRLDSATEGWRVQFDATSVSLRAFDGLNSSKIEIIYDGANLTTPSVDEWHHLVFTYSGGSYPASYLDGAPVVVKEGFSAWSTLTMPTSAYNFRIGNSAGSNYYNGKLSEVCVFNYELSADQVTYLFNLNNPMAITGVKPVAYYPLGGNSNPTSLAGYPNLAVGGSVFNFDGSNDYIDCGNNSALQITGDLTISTWFKTSTNPGTNQRIISKDDGTNRCYMTQLDASGNAQFYIWNGNSAKFATSAGTDYRDGNWHHIVGIFDTSADVTQRLAIYIDGANVGYGNYSVSTIDNDPVNLEIGRKQDNTLFFNGDLSNAQVFNTALPATGDRSVVTIYNNGSPLTSMSEFSSLVAWWKLDKSEIYNNTSTQWSVDNNTYPSVYTSSLSFNGTSNLINCGDADNLSFGNGTTDSPFSISAWVNMTDATRFRIVNKGTVFADNYEYIFQSSGSDFLSFLLFDADKGARIGREYTTAITSLQGQWIHVACTYDGSRASSGLKIYLNALRVDNNDNNLNADEYIAMENTSNPLEIGASTGTSRYSNGQISNAAIFTTELTSTQITTIYNNGTPETSLSNSPLSWWKLNSVEDGLLDAGSASNDGTNSGATKYDGFVNALAGHSVNMSSDDLIQSTLYRQSPYSSYSVIFDGTDYFDFNNASTNMMSGKTDISISVWFKLNSNTTGSTASNWYGGSTGSTTAKYLIRYNSGAGLGIQWYIHASGIDTYRIDSEYFPNVGDWVHVVGVKDSVTNGGQIRLYINGAESTNSPQDNTDFSAALSTDNFDDQIGVFNDVSSPMDGSISNVAYWTNTALTLADVVELYNGGVPADLSSFSGTAPNHWCPLDGKKVYDNGSVIVARDAIGTLQATGVNLVQENIVGNAPGSSANGTGTNLTIADLKGYINESTKNSYSINMADYGEPNSQGVTPAESGRTTEVPPS